MQVNGGIQYVPQIAVQYVYLDFDGELTSYNGEILTVENVEVIDSKLSAERIAAIVAELNTQYASQNVIFVAERPTVAEYSTIYIGKTSAFEQYGSFAGLAETIDSGNKNKSDKAFVMLDASSSNESIISTISHETDHLLGTLNHGNDKSVKSYAMELNLAQHIADITKLTLEYKQITTNLGNLQDAVYQANIASANHNVEPYKVSSNWQVNKNNTQVVNGTASRCKILGHQMVHGKAIDCIVYGGYQFVWEYAKNTILMGRGDQEATQHISAAEIHNTVVSSGGVQFIGPTTMEYSYVYNNVVLSGGQVFVGSQYDKHSTHYLYGACFSNSIINSGAEIYITDSCAKTRFCGTTYLAGEMYFIDADTDNSTRYDCDTKETIYNYGVIIFGVDQRRPYDTYIISNLDNFYSPDYDYAITIEDDMAYGSYKLAKHSYLTRGISIADIDTSQVIGTASINGPGIKYKGEKYCLRQSNGNLTLTVEAAAEVVNTDIKNRGYSQILAWDRNRGAVGMADNQGTTPAPWRGVWDWDDKDAALWRVAGAGHFKGTNVGYDGILLYNGVGNRFAAWTDINTGSYGYVNLCKVEGSFNTRSLADLDGNEYDDILIYDETGSFGVVLDGTTYKDIWHVDKGKFNTWDIIGAGKFDNGMDKLVTENNYNHQIYLWTNNDPTFNTWNWSTKSIGTLAKGDEVVAIGDFQGDGIDDIVVQLADGNMWCWDNGNSQTKRWIGNPGENFTVEAVGDYNGDGKEDILLREQASGWGGLGYWGAGYAGNWTDMKTRIETDTRISGSKFDIIA